MGLQSGHELVQRYSATVVAVGPESTYVSRRSSRSQALSVGRPAPSYVTVQSPFGAPVILSRYIQILCLFCFLSNFTTPMEPKCSAMSASVASGGRPLTYTMSQSLSPSSNDMVSGLYAMMPRGLTYSHLQNGAYGSTDWLVATVATGQTQLLLIYLTCTRKQECILCM